MGHHEAVEHVLRFFVYKHLPAHLQAYSKPFAVAAPRLASGSLAMQGSILDDLIADMEFVAKGREQEEGLRKLLRGRRLFEEVTNSTSADDAGERLGCAIRKIMEAKDCYVRAALSPPK